MSSVTYLPEQDELQAEFGKGKRMAAFNLDGLHLMADEDGGICSIRISSFTEALKEFRKDRKAVRLGGLWRGAKFGDREIKASRRELTRKLVDQW
jgi:hypothetical protein